MATDNRLRLTGVGLVLGLTMGLGSAATAAIDMSGDWGVRIANPIVPTFITLDFHVTQTGTAISINGVPGTIDPDSGTFSATDFSQPCPPTIAGVVDPSGTTFSGTYTVAIVGSGGRCAYLPGAMEGRRCGNGVVDAGEACDDHNFVDGDCCDSTCQVQAPAGTSCTGSNTCTQRACTATGTCEVTSTAPDGTACDDGLFCDGADECSAGQCIAHAGNPCIGGPPCQNVCSETAASCVASRFIPCPDDGNACSADYCDGAGACTHPPRAQGFACADDGLGCTADYCDSGGACIHPPQPAGTVCRPSGSACDPAERCTGAAGACPANDVLPAGAHAGCPACEACDGSGTCAPIPQAASTCVPGPFGGSTLALRNRTADARDTLAWRWRSPQSTPVATFGHPDTGGGYALCAWDVSGPTPQARLSVHVPGGGQCGGRSCWRRTATGWRFRDDGALSLTVRSRTGSPTRLALHAKGVATPLPGLPIGLPLVVQLQSEGEPAACWEARYSHAATNEASHLRLRSD